VVIRCVISGVRGAGFATGWAAVSFFAVLASDLLVEVPVVAAFFGDAVPEVWEIPG
jgi:hypothetical protein